MSDKEADIKTDTIAEDHGEAISAMEPLLVQGSSRFRHELADLALELTAKERARNNFDNYNAELLFQLE